MLPGQPPRARFGIGLAAFVLVYFCYGLHRFSLGLDLTDEGAQLAWPWSIHLGEEPFASELMTLPRPVEVYLGHLFQLHPGATVFEIRMLGWSLHLVGFGVLALYLFRLVGRAAPALLLASIPLFACNIFGNPVPNYNTVSANFLLMAL